MIVPVVSEDIEAHQPVHQKPSPAIRKAVRKYPEQPIKRLIFRNKNPFLQRQ